jgi:transposase
MFKAAADTEMLAHKIRLKPNYKQRECLARQQRLQRSLSRKQKGSRNRAKAKMKLARHHLKVADIRRDALHELTTRLVTEFTVIGIEDLKERLHLEGGASFRRGRRRSDAGLRFRQSARLAANV